MKEETLTTATLKLKNPQEALALFGEGDTTLRRIRELSSARLSARGDTITISGEAQGVERTEAFLRDLLAIIRQGGQIEDALERSAALSAQGKSLSEETAPMSGLNLPNRLRPKTPGQTAYLEAINRNDIVFGIGPAGTGKTYLAVAMAVAALKARKVKRIILTRPAVEAGERLGFLPGDLQAKIDPYLRPLYDALYDMLEVDKFEGYLQNGIIEVAPLAFMRGRTLNDAFIILDEAQNTTPEQMKMFLTRMGFSSKVVVTGDVTQIDLPRHVTSGLAVARKNLQNIEGIAFHHFTESDVVRHPLVGRIIKAYDVADAEEEARQEQRRREREQGAQRSE
ncbi:phosphate starvation-inducible PhoH-like protein [Deinobacterium chartae]|uniref:PhoH-like protein n=1 Tax=Deinobacterium chartae TaxID=521158 RepID=A0A841HYA1_9DEIO|nr:PhoH family protein [Deinobacterium chartae]MBB6098377.1 phosphate starvation-inducible PhoH-like protein [Deinobacterium chartae]